MKKINYLVALFAIAFLAFSTSCGDDDDGLASFVGTWTVTDVVKTPADGPGPSVSDIEGITINVTETNVSFSGLPSGISSSDFTTAVNAEAGTFSINGSSNDGNTINFTVTGDFTQTAARTEVSVEYNITATKQ
ncbi:MAG: hypothetical protein LAT68_03465 [Cyclobacteriaceae bacterium]|nr:hypothetical protein [Cyclobacteriaceae bacterium]MCH8515367.1 hypothetical protein [Cyclobacteriaceae bacterium]